MTLLHDTVVWSKTHSYLLEVHNIVSVPLEVEALGATWLRLPWLARVCNRLMYDRRVQTCADQQGARRAAPQPRAQRRVCQGA